jgi:hypothetical protein
MAVMDSGEAGCRGGWQVSCLRVRWVQSTFIGLGFGAGTALCEARMNDLGTEGLASRRQSRIGRRLDKRREPEPDGALRFSCSSSDA